MDKKVRVVVFGRESGRARIRLRLGSHEYEYIGRQSGACYFLKGLLNHTGHIGPGTVEELRGLLEDPSDMDSARAVRAYFEGFLLRADTIPYRQLNIDYTEVADLLAKLEERLPAFSTQ